MWWVKVLMVVWGVWMVEAKPEARGPTWAEVMGALPRKTSQHTVQKADNKNNYNDDYDSSFFGNSDYVYVDTDDENYKPPPPQPKDENPQAAERRTLDFLFHTFMDSNKPRQGNDGRPTRDTTTTTRRPTLIEAVFKTIDDHILEDLKEWSNYMSHDDKAPTTLPPTNLAQAAAIQQASPNNDELLLVTDEKGQQHIVTINDIVTSLGHLDEKTLTELLLPPQQNVAAVESNRRIFSPLPPSKLTENDSVLPQSKPVLLGTTTSNNIPRSVRHTGSIKNVTESENEVYMVQDEQGIVHVVSLNEILTSLSQLNEESVNELLFGPPDGTTNSLSSTPVIDPTLALSQSVLSKKTSASIPTKTHGLEAISTPSAPISNNPFPSAKVTSDHNKNSVSNHEASVFLNQQDSTQKAATQPAIPTKLPAQQIRGSLVRTDSEGNIYITPKPGQSYNIQDILAIAEQTAQPSAAELPPSTNTNNFLKQNEKEQNPHRGQEVLSFLAGSGAKLPTTIQPTVPTASALSKHQPNVNALQQSLIRAFQQQSPTNSGAHPLTQYLTSQPIIQPIVQPTLQPVTQPPPGGFGATLSGLFSRLLGYPEEKQQQVPQQLQPTPPTNNPEYINLVVKQQGRNNNDGIFGAVTIPLPKPIHYQQKKSVQLPNSLQDSSQSSPGDKDLYEP